MRKLGLVTLALVLALGTVGVAYAGWTDALTIEGEVQTGSMEVRFRDTGTEVVDGCWDSISITEQTDKKLTLLLEDLYPRKAPCDGAAYPTLIVNIINDGTVPVKLTSLEVERISGSGPVELYNNLWMAISEYVDAPDSHFAVKDLGNVDLEDFVLEPGQDLDEIGALPHFTWLIWLHEDAGDNLQNQSVEVEVTLNFEQANLQ